MWLLLIPLVVLVILGFTAASLVAGLFWMLGAWWPWLLIGLGMWMFWHEDGRHRRQRKQTRTPHLCVPHSDARHSTHAASVAAKSSAAATASGPRPLRQTELPIDIQVKVEQIRRKVDVLLGYADRFPPFSQDLYLVRQTAGDYLPRTINAYLALPRQTADQPLSANGRTAHEELKGQLDLLDAKLDDIAQDLQRQDADRLLANRRFLESRFGVRSPGSAAPSAAEPASEVA
jgi:hypothetical protein